MALLSYEQFKQNQAAKGINIKGGDQSYNKYTAAYAGGKAGGITGQTGAGGFEKGVAYDPTPGAQKFTTAQKVGGTAAGAAAGAAAGVGSGLALAGGLSAAGPVGWAVGAGLLAYSAMKGKKTNKQFEGTRDTGGAQAWVAKGGTLASSEGKIPTMAEFRSKGRWLLPQDEYAHDYGGTFENVKEADYKNFEKTAQGYLDSGDMDRYYATLEMHGFKGGRPAPAPAPSGGGGGGGRREAAPSRPSAPAAAKVEEREDISRPAEGLESTIKTRAQKPAVERTRRTFLTGTSEEDAGTSSFLTRAG